MLSFIFGLLCAVFSIILFALYRAFEHVSAKELKRRAREGDEIAVVLYKSVAYGMSAKLLLAGLGLIALYASLVLLEHGLGVWLAIPVLVVLALSGYAFVEARGGSRKFAVWLALRVSPGLAWVLDRVQPVVGALVRGFKKLLPLHVHSGLYDTTDIAELLERQKHQTDNRISESEIDLLLNTLAFGQKTVADALVPKRVVKQVASEDAIGPVLMGELHASGHSRFPVHEKRKDNIVGILYLHDLVTVKQTGKVGDVMRHKLTYVHEHFTLQQTLQAFLRTKQHLFIVVNDFEEYVGIITIEDVLERLIGKNIVDEFDKYDDLRAVAARAAAKDHDKHVKQAAEEPTPEPTEVVE